MWSPGDGPTWGNCARALKAAHESTPILGKGRRRKCGARELSCAARSAAFKEDGYELMAIERWLDNGGDVCTLQTDMWYATLLRDPVSRVVSHHNHLRTTQRFASGQPRANKGRYFSGVFAPDGAAGERGAACRAAAELPESLGAPHREGYDWSMLCAITSNYQTRSLLGTAFSARPYDSTAVSKLSEAQVIAAAKYRLINFAFVGVVERADEAANMVRQTLGWRTWSESEVLPRAGRDASTARKVVSVPQPGNGSDLSLLLHHNALDTALYAYANELFDLDLAFFDHGARRNLFRKTISDKARLFCGRHPASKTGADAEEDAEDDDRADPAREVDADARGAGAAADAPGR
ncbi:hypothetical protein M885DRAFT_570862 [Pelagophyceae sp. CCMP2097]|nr:hypothetical protein M885DRAFT_570862 [Pelagophyceae sp. CCMP2097]